TRSGSPGQTLSYSLALKNNDSSSCPTTSFTLSMTLPPGFTGSFSASPISLAPGGTGSATLSVTSSSSSAAGSYSITAKATDSNDAAHQAAVSAMDQVIFSNPPLDTQAPNVSLTSPTDGSRVTVRSKVTLSAQATDNVGVTKVEFYVNGSLKCTAA